MDAQEAFEAVWEWFVLQRHSRSVSSKKYGDIFGCYRGAGALRCAIGVLVPDSIYFHEMEGMGVGAFYETIHTGEYRQDEPRWHRLRAYLDGVGRELLVDLQDLHDDCLSEKSQNNFLFCMREGLQTIALQYNLIIPRRRNEKSCLK